MNTVLKCAMATAGLALAAQAFAQVTFYEHEGFLGRSFSTQAQIGTFAREGFDDRASSVVVLRDRWEVCEDARFSGRCVVLRPGRYPSLAAMGLNGRASSVRPVKSNARIDDNRYAPAPIPVYDNRRRNGERVFHADVNSVRGIVGQPQRGCWIEPRANVPDADVGERTGGVLGHQVGGRDDGKGPPYAENVPRCSSVPGQAQPEYWDVTYSFRGQEHRMQVAAPPGRTVTVNAQGEPRLESGGSRHAGSWTPIVR